MSKPSEGQSLSHNLGYTCRGENCAVCLFNQETAYIREKRQGRVLTILEAAITDKQQLKALQDIIGQENWSWDAEYEKLLTERMHKDKPLFKEIGDRL